MSGSSGNGHDSGSTGGSSTAGAGGGGGGGGSSSDPCDIHETAPVNSPQSNVIRTLSVGDRLDIQVTGATSRRALQLVATAGVAGSLTHRGALAIVNCIDAGNVYDAEVLTINGGQVTVRISRI